MINLPFGPPQNDGYFSPRGGRFGRHPCTPRKNDRVEGQNRVLWSPHTNGNYFLVVPPPFVPIFHTEHPMFTKDPELNPLSSRLREGSREASKGLDRGKRLLGSRLGLDTRRIPKAAAPSKRYVPTSPKYDMDPQDTQTRDVDPPDHLNNLTFNMTKCILVAILWANHDTPRRAIETRNPGKRSSDIQREL